MKGMEFKKYIALLVIGVLIGFAAGKYVVHYGLFRSEVNLTSDLNKSSNFLHSDYFLKKQDFEKRYDSYSEAEKSIVLEHVQKALSGIGLDAEELEKAAAINDYIYQYLMLKDNMGGCAKLLNDGYALCGGAVVCMGEMLYSVGIKSKFAFLLGIPGQGAHSLLEVFLNDGSRGLFDPTFGMFWFDRDSKRTVSMMELLKTPSLCNTRLFKSQHKKRETDMDPIKVSTGYLSTYSLQMNYSEEYYDPYACFSQRKGGGVANEGLRTYLKIDLSPGLILGNKDWEPKEGGEPWSDLSLLKDKDNRYISWAYMLGQTMGYDVKHIYYLHNMREGNRYSLDIHYCRAYEDTTVSVQFIEAQIPTSYRKIQNRDFDPLNFKSSTLSIGFAAAGKTDSVLVDANGIMIIHAIELSCIPQ